VILCDVNGGKEHHEIMRRMKNLDSKAKRAISHTDSYQCSGESQSQPYYFYHEKATIQLRIISAKRHKTCNKHPVYCTFYQPLLLIT
jgi:hypothetical protein